MELNEICMDATMENGRFSCSFFQNFMRLLSFLGLLLLALEAEAHAVVVRGPILPEIPAGRMTCSWALPTRGSWFSSFWGTSCRTPHDAMARP